MPADSVGLEPRALTGTQAEDPMHSFADHDSSESPLSFAAAARFASKQIAIVCEQGEWTYGELAPLVERTVSWLQARLGDHGDWEAASAEGSGIRLRGRQVALVGVNRLPQLVAIYALVEAGIPFLLVHPRWPIAEREEILSPFAPDLVIDSDWRLPLDSETDRNRERENAAPRSSTIRIRESDPLAVLFTSGTSGRPKAAVLSRRAVLASARASAENMGWQENDRWLLSLPVAHVGGLSVVTRALIARRAIVVPPADLSSERAFEDWVGEKRVTLASLVPTQLFRLLEREPVWNPPAHLRAILLGGARASEALVERGRKRAWPLLLTYGLTEACSQVATQRYSALGGGIASRNKVESEESLKVGEEVRVGDRLPRSEELQGAALPPLHRVEIRIRPLGPDQIDQRGREVGAIEIRGPMLFDGYLVPREDGAFEVDASCFDGDGWFATGDHGRLDSEGRLLVADRGTDLVISGGENVYPSEVEAVLERHPSIVAACVFGVDDEEWGQQVAAVAVPGEGSLPSNKALVDYCERRLAGFQRPRLWLWVDQLAAAPSGKVDRRAVRDAAVEKGLGCLQATGS